MEERVAKDCDYEYTLVKPGVGVSIGELCLSESMKSSLGPVAFFRLQFPIDLSCHLTIPGRSQATSQSADRISRHTMTRETVLTQKCRHL